MSEHVIYLAGGCFWGMEKYISMIDGVLSTTVGYANGAKENPTYEDVCASSGHAETVKVVFDDEKLPLEFLLDIFYMAIDPVSVNKQGGDVGIQYRTGVYYTDERDGEIIRASLKKLSESYDKKIAVECCELENFYPAEEYHQKYLEKNPDGYCHITEGQFKCASSAVAPIESLGKIKNMFNLRDLGGYRCKDKSTGRVSYTKNGVFLRGDSTARLTKAECELLKMSGLTTVVDLRSEHEVKTNPSAFENFDGVDYINIPMLDNINSAITQDQLPYSLGELYCMSLEGAKAQTVQLIKILSEADGTVLFNCTAGKDRTGVVSMMLLSLAGVSNEDIVLDYVKTESRVQPLIKIQLEQLRKLGINAPESLLHADENSARMFLKVLNEKYGGAEKYLKAQTVSDEMVDKLVRKFVY